MKAEASLDLGKMSDIENNDDKDGEIESVGALKPRKHDVVEETRELHNENRTKRWN